MDEPDHVSRSRVVYDHSADLYVTAIGTAVSAEFEAPLDRAVLDAFAELVRARGAGAVLDAGCGPGRVAAYLADRGLDVRGVDIAAGMIAAARGAHPHLQFDEGLITDLPVSAVSLEAVVYWYSIITTPPAGLADVWHELRRVLRPGGLALVAFQAGDGESDERPDAYGSSVALTLYRHSVDAVIEALRDHGFDIRAEIRRQPELAHEGAPQAFIIVARPGVDDSSVN